ncbi:MAG: 6-O-methylguanine DNA methyltransferase [Armatimonadetes bacterium]|nr:MAG: 6-O-methylguanine DNA methyltransferase [Armatimonadota bacterium]
MTDDGGTFTEAVITVIEAIPAGEISTYGEVAAEAGFPGAARAVGHLLRTTHGLPWWRVISTNGRLVPGLEREHAQRLRAEGITVTQGKVRMGQPT